MPVEISFCCPLNDAVANWIAVDYVQDILWQGQIAGVDAALETFKADKALPMSKLYEVIEKKMYF